MKQKKGAPTSDSTEETPAKLSPKKTDAPAKPAAPKPVDEVPIKPKTPPASSEDDPIPMSQPVAGIEDDIPVGKASGGAPSWAEFMKQTEQVLDNLIVAKYKRKETLPQLQ